MPNNDPIRAVYNACNPTRVPTAQEYVDCSPARGGTRLADLMEREIRRSDTPLHLLFSGHMGAGKSTELRQLQQALECDGNCDPGRNPFFCVYVDYDEFIDVSDVELIEVLLGLVTQLAQQLRDRAGIELQSSYFSRRWDELKEVFGAAVEIDSVEFSFADLAKVSTSLKNSPAFRLKVRAALGPQEPTLLAEVNHLFDDARAKLRDNYDDIVIIVDSLEKIIERKDKHTGRTSHYLLFVARGEQWSALESHLVLTVPLPLLRSPDRQSLQTIFGTVAHVLPVIKVADRNGEDSEEGIARLREVLDVRFTNVGVQPDTVFDTPETCRELCKISGGHIRQLFMVFRSACGYVESLPVTRESLDRAIQSAANGFASSIAEEHWPSLRRLDEDSDRHLPNDQIHQDLLYSLSVFEYLNGEEPWYAVNPLVRRLSRFQKE